MFDTTQLVVDGFVEQLDRGFTDCFGNDYSSLQELLCQSARDVMHHITMSDALYHNYEHTILVTTVGQTILAGKQQLDGSVSPETWVNTLLAMLCHDIGYARELVNGDHGNLVARGIADERVSIAAGSSDASLMPYHVDRGKLYVREHFSSASEVDVDFICQSIERTRFPIPKEPAYQQTGDYPGLVRGADLIGQLSDPRYLSKLSAIFYEFEENGFNARTGYTSPGDLLLTYPSFFNEQVLPYLKDSLLFLEQTEEGREVIENLQANVDAARIASSSGASAAAL